MLRRDRQPPRKTATAQARRPREIISAELQLVLVRYILTSKHHDFHYSADETKATSTSSPTLPATDKMVYC